MTQALDDFELSCISLENGRGVVTVKVEAITDSANIEPNMAQKIYIVANNTYDYISVNDFNKAEKNCVKLLSTNFYTYSQELCNGYLYFCELDATNSILYYRMKLDGTGLTKSDKPFEWGY